MSIRQFDFSLPRLVPLFHFKSLSSKLFVDSWGGYRKFGYVMRMTVFLLFKRILWCPANGFWYKANSSQLKIIFKMPISIFVVSRTNPKKLPLINWWPVIKVSFSRSFVLTSHFPFYIRLKTHIIRISKPETRIFIHIWWLFKWFL